MKSGIAFHVDNAPAPTPAPAPAPVGLAPASVPANPDTLPTFTPLKKSELWAYRAPEGRKVLIVGADGCWSIDAAPHIAWLEAFRPKRFNAYAVVAGTRVSDAGSIQYPGDYLANAPKLLGKY